MNKKFLDRQGRIRPSFVWMVVLLVVMLAACSAPTEPEATAPVARETSTTVPTVESEATAAPTLVPTDEPAPSPALTPTKAPFSETGPIPQKGTLPVVDEVSFEILAQYGGAPLAVAVADGTAYVGFGPRLVTLDVSDPADPQMIGESELLADNIRDIVVVEGMAYLAAGRTGLAVIDATDAANPVVLSAGPNYGGANRPSAETVHVEAGMAYLTDYNRMEGITSLIQLDVSDPANVRFVESLPIQNNDNLEVANGRLVIAGNGRIEIRDMADLETILGEQPLASGDYITQVVVQGNIAYVIETGIVAGIERFDISNPESPTAIGELAPIEFSWANRAAAANETTLFNLGTYGEFGFCSSQVDVIDISGQQPVKTALFGPDSCVMDMALDGSHLYLAGRNGLKIFDISNSAAVVEVSLFTHPDGLHDAQAVAVNENVTYVLTAEGFGTELRTLNLTGETAEPYAEPLMIGNIVLLDLFIQDTMLIAPQWQGGLYTFDLSNSTEPQLSYSPEGSDVLIGDLFSIFFHEEVAYLPIVDGTLIGGVGVMDLSDPENPQIASTFETRDYTVVHMTGGNGYLYILAQGEAFSVHIYDISDPLAPKAAGKVTMPEVTNRLALVGDTLFAACDRWNCQSLYAIDVSDPESAEIVGQWQINIGVQELVPAGAGLFYISTVEQGVWLLNAGDPANPYLAGRIELAGDFARLKVQDGVVYAATYDGGLYVLAVH